MSRYVLFECPRCHQLLQAADEHIAKRVACTLCSHRMDVPSDPVVAEPEEGRRTLVPSAWRRYLNARQARLLGPVLVTIAAAMVWFLIGQLSDLDKASHMLTVQEFGGILGPDEKVGALPQIAIRAATRPLWAGLIGGVFVGLWGLVCWGLRAITDPGMTGELVAARGTAIIGGLVGAVIGGGAGLIGGALACLLPPSIGLAVFGLFFGCAMWCVLLTIPKPSTTA